MVLNMDRVMGSWKKIKSSVFSHFSPDDSPCDGSDSSPHTLGNPPPNSKPTAANPVEDAAITSKVPEDSIAAAAAAAAAAEVDGGERDYNRKGKMAYNLTLGVTGISVTLLVNMPHPIEAGDKITLYACEGTLACLSLITSIGLIYYSFFSPVGATLAWVQDRVTFFSVLSLICAVIFRVAAMFPFGIFITMMLVVVAAILLLMLALYLAATKSKKTS